MNDVVPPSGDRSIRNIPLPTHRKGRSAHPTSDGPLDTSRRAAPERPIYRDRGPRKSSRVLWALAVALVGILIAVLAAILFSGASVTIVPRQATVAVPAALTAYADAPLGALPFTTATDEATASRTVPANGERQVSRQSSGVIVISNTYSTAPQRLIKNTRFEAPDGKIYRINESVEVPGAKKAVDGSLTAGTIEATVFADSPGPAYDRGIDTFTIPGFKGDPRYAKFSARGKTPITGGFIGTEKVVSDADRAAAEEGIRAELTEKLKASLAEAAPQDRILIPGSIRYDFTSVPDTTSGGAQAAITLTGTATGALVREADLATAIAKASVAGYDGAAVAFRDRAQTGIQAKEPVSADATELALAGSGQVVLVWQIDTAAIQNLLAGLSEDQFAVKLRGAGPGVIDGKASIKPFWRKSFPADPEEITVRLGDPREASQ